MAARLKSRVGSLGRYHRKRDFRRTPEPRGRVARRSREKEELFFCVQRHHATRLHYDFRLELDGVLKSWAVPKGPSLNPGDKRLAVHVEDHPLDYGMFEGTIPKGEYGAGEVILWDQGVWIPIGDPREGYRAGKLKLTLKGKKLSGRWALFRMGGASEPGKDNWLLVKERDEAADPSRNITEDRPESVLSGKLPSPRAKKGKRALPRLSDAPGARTASLAERIEPQLATLVEEMPSGEGWLHEIKFDGYRLLARLEKGQVQLITRGGKDWTGSFSGIAAELSKLAVRGALIDGEAVVLDEEGASRFQLLQNALSEGNDDSILFYAFDLLHLDGYDLTQVPLLQRKELLQILLENSGLSRVRYADHVAGSGEAFHREACRFALEGTVSKRQDGPYVPGRGLAWLKVKCTKHQEFVIGGFTEPKGSRAGLGALLLGVQGPDGRLVYAGKVGTGFTETSLKTLRAALRPRITSACPFVPQPRGPAVRGARWVEPRLLAEVEFSEWTRDGRLRHPSFLGLREDKSSAHVVREEPVSLPRQVSNGHDDVFAGIRLTNPDRILYPEQGITKRDLARYYVEIADWILPHIRNRILSLVRCPAGHGKECFYQKHATSSTPEAIRRKEIRDESGLGTYVYIDDLPGLITLVQIGVLEIHPWGSQIDRLENPDRCVFDLDPAPDVPWPEVIQMAHLVRGHLQELGLESFLKTTGGKGLHLVVPLDARRPWDEVKAFSKEVAEEIVRRAPDRAIARMSKAARTGKIFIDYLRNGRGATAVAPYSTRARAGAPVAVPLSWDELGPDLRPDQYTVLTVPHRLASLSPDPWKPLLGKIKPFAFANRAK